MSIRQPSDLIPRPWADSGTKTVIPDTQQEYGAASFTDGFPIENSIKPANGGLPPRREDFNGILWMLTSYVLWGQSGGMWDYRETRDYNVPAIIYRNGAFYSCLKENGPGTAEGVHKPEDGGEYWIRFQPNALMFIDSGFAVRNVLAQDRFDTPNDATAKLTTGLTVKINGKVLDISSAEKRTVTPDGDGYADTGATVSAISPQGDAITMSTESYFKLTEGDEIRIGDADTGITATIDTIDGRDLTLISASADITDALIGSQVYAIHDAEMFTVVTVSRNELTADDETKEISIASEYLPLPDIVPATNAEVETGTGDGYIKASQASLVRPTTATDEEVRTATGTGYITAQQTSLIKPAMATTSEAGIIKLAEIPTDD